MSIVQPISIDRLPADAIAPDVTLYTGTLYSGGAERVLLNLAHEFASRGLRVDFLVSKYLGALKEEVPPGVRLVSLDVSRVLFSVPRYLKYLKVSRTPIVISSVENANLVSCVGRRLSSHQHSLVLRIDNALYSMRSIATQWRRWGWILGAVATFKWADRLVAISSGLRTQVARTLSIATSDIVLIYNPLLSPELDRKALESPDLPIGFRESDPWFVAVGRLNVQKDYPTLIRAFADVRKKLSCQLIILGEGDDLSSLMFLCTQLGVERDVFFLGFRSNPFAYMRSANAFVLSSAWEGFGNVVAEALAAGAKVISTDCPYGPAEILGNGEFGRLVPVGDIDALASAMRAVLVDPVPLSGSSLLKHLRQFEIEGVGDQYLELLSRLSGSATSR